MYVYVAVGGSLGADRWERGRRQRGKQERINEDTVCIYAAAESSLLACKGNAWLLGDGCEVGRGAEKKKDGAGRFFLTLGACEKQGEIRINIQGIIRPQSYSTG